MSKLQEFVRSPWALWVAILVNLFWVEFRTNDRYTASQAFKDREEVLIKFQSSQDKDIQSRATMQANQHIMIEQLRIIHGTLLALKGHYQFTTPIGTAPKTGAHTAPQAKTPKQRTQ